GDSLHSSHKIGYCRAGCRGAVPWMRAGIFCAEDYRRHSGSAGYKNCGTLNECLVTDRTAMPRRELKNGRQVADWLQQLAQSLSQRGEMILIGSSALLWHAHYRGIAAELPEASMDVDPITNSDEVARICYDSVIGSEFEKEKGWHVNLMPGSVLNEFPVDWKNRAVQTELGFLTLL